MQASLSNKRVAVLATDGFEESELTSPCQALRGEGAHVDVISLKPGEIQAFKHHDKSIMVKVDRLLKDVIPSDYDALVLPGGALNADALRMNEDVQAFVRTFFESGKPLAVICHAPWILISAGVAKGLSLTSYHSIQDDLKNAGAEWLDSEVVIEENVITSRQPSDLPAFNRETIRLIQLTKIPRAVPPAVAKPAA